MAMKTSGCIESNMASINLDLVLAFWQLAIATRSPWILFLSVLCLCFEGDEQAMGDLSCSSWKLVSEIDRVLGKLRSGSSVLRLLYVFDVFGGADIIEML